MSNSTCINEKLFALRDEKFKDFSASLIPSIPQDTVIGVKTPELKRLAKELSGSGEAAEFIKTLPHKYFEENQLHAFIISDIKDFDRAMYELERFLPYVDNWATCDQLIPRALAKSPERILDRVSEWLKSGKTYTVRFGIEHLMRHFLDERFDEKYLYTVAKIQTEEYYINMMSAWYFATALAKQYDATYPLFENHTLPLWVHNKAIQKACESRRVPESHKEVLKALKRRE